MTIRLFLLLSTALLAACQTVPPTNVHQPMSARPVVRPTTPAGNGAIYQVGFSRPLFEDRRARYVGDTITIKITENTSASTKSNAKVERESAMNASVNGISRLPGSSLVGLGIDATSSNTFDAKGDAANNNVFTGTLTATVIEVLANGNLLVSGEKQLAIGQQTEYIRVSGVINPSFVSIANEIESAKIADARIEYKSAGYISEAQVMGWLARFFLSVLPF
ncbi:MAG TPA: flagellar basal body L-ring protein FlgH [Rhodocyclaceae bacterium]|nr:flagellar basal body L-ring protein FlgH [Rhodocyclaceae bacterium]